ncbi:MAG: nucleoside-diphosphate sugar epimerase [Gammaproteobacteria bacterium]|nr:MAG: nucleoside-diphosphate sugar epimerase [Gammaproteobacteria bacterium]RLA62162.1 MAG: nucleoside-diphosphate sugar epimerase [Gammaproteobacteria bacterium]
MPVIWLIDAYRAGERGQVRALVDALGWPCEIKVLSYHSHLFWPHVLGQTTLRGITAESAATLRQPWPDLVVSCGVRNEPVCRWIRAQSGGHTRYVHVGRPWASLDSFDLVITTPQYRVPQHPNVLNNMLTLQSVTPQSLVLARSEWAAAFAELPRPYFAVIVGGDSGPFTLGPKAAARLARQASRLARKHGGSLLVSTSSRTSEAAVVALRANIDVPNYCYRWQSTATANPYLGILAWADRLIVTGDSIAMLSEACATGKLVQMFDLGGMRGGGPASRDFRLSGVLYAVLMRWFWQPLSRDLTLVHSQLRESGRAVWLDEEFAAAMTPVESDLQRAVAAVQELLEEV